MDRGTQLSVVLICGGAAAALIASTDTPTDDTVEPAIASPVRSGPRRVAQARREPRPGGRGPEAAYVTDTGLSAAGRVALRWLEDARNHGLEGLSPPSTARERAIGAALLNMAVALRHRPRKAGVLKDARGDYQPPDILWRGVTVHPTPSDAEALLEAARTGPLALDAHLRAQLPPHPQYAPLVDATRRYRALCAGPPWPQVQVPKKDQAFGRRWRNPEAVETLQRRLAMEGFFDAAPTGSFGPQTTAALRAYQRARSLRERGWLNRKTALSLNRSCEDRLKILELNVRRLRVSGITTERSYLAVNLPGFEARHAVAGEPSSTHRIIVGQGKSFWSKRRKRRIYRNRTPILTDAISNVVINPPWKLPRRIIRDEVMPALEKNAKYLEEKGYVRRVAANGYQMIVQPPGPKNALGDVKLSFPNREGIYIHDTNARGLFRLPRRDFSHGCVRLEKPLKVAQRILERDQAAGPTRHRLRGLTETARGNRTWGFPLNVRVPVFFEYYTATVTDEGVVRFHPDIYDYDHIALVGPYGRRKPRE